jgi:peptidyl-prolyl cis-trans isomerase D
MQMVADQMHDALVKAPGSAAEIAKKFGAELITVPKASPGEAIPTLGSSPEIDSVLQGMKPNDVSNVTVLPANRLAVVVLNSVSPSRPAEFSEVQDQLRQKYVNEQAQRLAEDKAKEAAERIKKGESMEQVAKSLKLEVVTSMFFGRNDSVEGLGSSVYVEDAFVKPEGAILGPTNIQGREVISKVVAKQQADPSALPAERADLIAKIRQQKNAERQELLMDSITAKLQSDGKLKRYEDNIKRVAATYQQPQR